MEIEKINLTEYSKGAGCGCKIAPNVLQEILASETPKFNDERLLVGNGNNDDAAVYAINDKDALISTTDFFLPIVDDAYTFGQVAAANSLSDVWAMGGQPILALAILGWPIEKIAPAIAKEVLEGARDICAKAGIVLAGGHTIDSQDPIFGLSVNGLVAQENIKQNNAAKIDDLIILAKPIGVGILSTAQKRKLISTEDQNILINQLTTLNTVGYELGKLDYVHAMTDVTGFGLAGHLLEICEASGVQAIINYDSVPKIAAALPYITQRVIPDATYRNWNSYNKHVGFDAGVNVMEAFNLLPDPQTNGGLLITVQTEKGHQVLDILKQHGWADAAIIGKITDGQDKTIHVKA